MVWRLVSLLVGLVVNFVILFVVLYCLLWVVRVLGVWLVIVVHGLVDFGVCRLFVFDCVLIDEGLSLVILTFCW